MKSTGIIESQVQVRKQIDAPNVLKSNSRDLDTFWWFNIASWNITNYTLEGRSSINRPFLLAIQNQKGNNSSTTPKSVFKAVLCCPRIESSAGEGRVSAQRDMKTEPRARLLARRNPESGVEQRGAWLLRIGILMFGDILISIIFLKRLPMKSMHFLVISLRIIMYASNPDIRW